MSKSTTRNIAPGKLKAIEELKKLAESHGTIGLVRVSSIPANRMTSIRAKLRGIATIRVAKKSVMMRAFQEVKNKPGLMALLDQFHEKRGPSGLLFSNEKAIKLRRMLDENKFSKRAKVGEVLSTDLVIPASNTKLPPGPVVTEFSAIGLQTKVQDGTIWVSKDATVLKAGDPVGNKLYSVLVMLNINPVEVLVDLYAAFENDEILTKDVLTINIEAYKEKVLAAYSNALKLSVEAGYVTPKSAKLVLLKAYTRAKAVAMKLPIIFPQFVKEYIMKAQAQALALDAAVKGEPLVAPAAPSSTGTDDGNKKHDDKDASNDKKEEEADVGLGDLFG